MEKINRKIKRIKCEIINFNYLDNNFIINYINDNYIIVVIENKYKFIFKEDYPFKAPEFYIYNKNYNNYVIPLNRNIDKIVHYYFNCPHCFSIINKWTPTYFMKDLINEYEDNVILYKKSYLIYFITQIFKKYINDKYLFFNIIDYIMY